MNEKKQVILKVDQESPQDDTESTERKYTLKEICERFGFDVEMLGDYDPENDCFN